MFVELNIINPDPPEAMSYEGRNPLFWGIENISCWFVADPSHDPVMVTKLPIFVKYPMSLVILEAFQPVIDIWEQAIASFSALPCLASNAYPELVVVRLLAIPDPVILLLTLVVRSANAVSRVPPPLR